MNTDGLPNELMASILNQDPEDPLLALAGLFAVATLDRLDVSDSLPSMKLLPNEILSLILNDPSIPLSQRIHLRAMSSRWQAVIEDGLKKETKIVLRDNTLKQCPQLSCRNYHRDDFYYNIHTPVSISMPFCSSECRTFRGNRVNISKKANNLVVSDGKYFSAELFCKLTRLFPSVSDLTVDINNKTNFDKLPNLLSQYSTTLKSFTLYGDYSPTIYYPRAFSTFNLNTLNKPLANALNCLPYLTSLHLFARNVGNYLLPNLKPTLAHLERFSFYDRNIKQDDLQLSYLIYASLSNDCTHLGLHNNHLNWSSTKFDSTLTHLNLSGYRKDGDDLINKAAKFRSLESLTIDQIELDTFHLYILARLDRLTELRIEEFRYNAFVLPLPSPDDLLLINIKRLHLGTVIIPYLCGETRDKTINGYEFCKKIIYWFPFLKQFTVKRSGHYKTIMEGRDMFPDSTAVSVEPE